MVHRDLSIVARGGILLLSRSLAHLEITAPEFFLLLYLYENDRSRQEDLVVHNWHQMILKDIPEEDYQVFERVLKLMALNIATNLANEEAGNEK